MSALYDKIRGEIMPVFDMVTGVDAATKECTKIAIQSQIELLKSFDKIPSYQWERIIKNKILELKHQLK